MLSLILTHLTCPGALAICLPWLPPACPMACGHLLPACSGGWEADGYFVIPVVPVGQGSLSLPLCGVGTSQSLRGPNGTHTAHRQPYRLASRHWHLPQAALSLGTSGVACCTGPSCWVLVSLSVKWACRHVIAICSRNTILPWNLRSWLRKAFPPCNHRPPTIVSVQSTQMGEQLSCDGPPGPQVFPLLG